MKSVLHKAETRGHADHGWLDTYHTFSFAGYYNPERIHFGVLRVLNDDTVAGGMGFGTHPHDNMEIISIPLEGELEHRDSMGNRHVIRAGEVQVMSAGTGVTHSEKNLNRDQLTRFLQIWVFPNRRDVEPRYAQQAFPAEGRRNQLQQVLSPDPNDEGVWIHQDAWFHLIDPQADHAFTYRFRRPENGLYIFVLEGEVEAAGFTLGRRDGLGIHDTDSVDIRAVQDSRLLLMEVPMQNTMKA